MPTQPASDLDPSFGAGGLTIVPIGGMVRMARRGLFVFADGRTSLFALATNDEISSPALLRIDLPANGHAEGARVSSPLPGLNAVAVAFAPDGAAIVLGERGDESGIVAARLTPDGDLDPGFGESGFAATNLGSATDVLPLADGRIVAMGHRDREQAIARLTARGALDRTFGRDGVAPLLRPPGTDVEKSYTPTDIGGLPDGRLIVAVNFLDSIAVSAQLIALTSTGELDRAYGDQGIVSTFPGAGGRVLATSDGRVGWLVNGALNLVSADGRAAIAVVFDTSHGAPRFDALDETGHRGFLLAGYDLVPDEPRRTGCDPGSGDTCLRKAVAVQSVDPDGVLDAGFGAGGTAVTDLPAPYGASGTEARAIVASPAGRLTVAANACDSEFHCDVAVLRYREP